MSSEGLTIKLKDELDLQEIGKSLASLKYENISPSPIEKEGQFSIRGGVVDIWLERYKSPVRLDLIGAKIEDIYLFNFLTQIKIKKLKEVYILAYKSIPKLETLWKKKKITLKKGTSEHIFLSEIEPGDIVVHIDYGIGKFKEIVSENGNQVLIVEYAKGDKLHVPISQIDRLTRYIGAGYRPRLNNLGGGGWETIKAKVERSLITIAKDLLKVYAQRQVIHKNPFSPDSPWQEELEGSFEFEETADQIKALEEIKKDMESPRPMDRLLVGDVGFGKTEIALRATFKAVVDSRQVVLLAPTTILVEQHYHLFKERLKKFPVNLALLSRFQNKTEQTKSLREIEEGKTDIVIGTHRLLSKDVKFKNLGLVIIDEEHRFGVEAKEKLKAIRNSIDVLSLSATPIPRSLQMALTKIRDMSVLSQPPIGRQPIETVIERGRNEKIKEALGKELFRGGQVYFVHNNVSTIAKKANEIISLVPRSKVVFAHGQMKEKDLAETMDRFYSKKADVLVCTTIIGSGIDMPNVNTIIIEDAQNFGLADLHQLRGRVGRSFKKAYAYLFYPENYTPSDESFERLDAIKQTSQLGGGFALAQKDLEIRGAGNLLGRQQSGNIALVGYELYLQLLSQAVEKLQ